MDAALEHFHNIVKAVGEIPQNWWVIFLSLMLSFVGTQWIKAFLTAQELSDRNYRIALRVIATLFAFVPCLLLWQGENWSVWVGLLLGFSSPMLYKLLTHLLYKRWPDLEKILSGKADDQ